MHDVLAVGQRRAGGSSPACSHSSYGCSAASVGLDLVVVDDPALGGVDEEHPARLQPALADDVAGVDVEHADLGGQHDEAVVGDPVAARAQAVAVEHGADCVPSVNATQAGPSQGSISEEWNS